jgi:hypothetical protein
LRNIVHGDAIKARIQNLANNGFEKFGRDLEYAVWLKIAGGAGKHVVQHEDDAIPAEKWRSQSIRSGIVKGGQCSFQQSCRPAAHLNRSL